MTALRLRGDPLPRAAAFVLRVTTLRPLRQGVDAARTFDHPFRECNGHSTRHPERGARARLARALAVGSDEPAGDDQSASGRGLAATKAADTDLGSGGYWAASGEPVSHRQASSAYTHRRVGHSVSVHSWRRAGQ